ncbi:MAG: hypothetical protein Q9182_001981 [Xanthomendoza sp. 2 TL-2023]
MAQALAEAGAEAIALLDRNEDLGEEAASRLSTHAKIPVKFYKTDVRDANANTRTIEQVVSDLGSVDILINSAGIVQSYSHRTYNSSNIKAESYDPDSFRYLLDINLTGSFLISQACAQHMIKSPHSGSGGGCSIIFISSIAGARVLHPQQQCAYNASKAAVVQLAKSLAAEWAQLQQQMSYWKTITPMARVGEPDELNGLAVFLSSDAARFMTGSNVFCDGGYHVY